MKKKREKDKKKTIPRASPKNTRTAPRSLSEQFGRKQTKAITRWCKLPRKGGRSLVVRGMLVDASNKIALFEPKRGNETCGTTRRTNDSRSIDRFTSVSGAYHSALCVFLLSFSNYLYLLSTHIS